MSIRHTDDPWFGETLDNFFNEDEERDWCSNLKLLSCAYGSLGDNICEEK